MTSDPRWCRPVLVRRMDGTELPGFWRGEGYTKQGQRRVLVGLLLADGKSELLHIYAATQLLGADAITQAANAGPLPPIFKQLTPQEMTWTEHLIREAVEAERERCAKIAEKLNSDKVASGEYEHGYWDACNEVAVAIRKECKDV